MEQEYPKAKYEKEFEEFIKLFHTPIMSEDDKESFREAFCNETGLTPEIFSAMIDKGIMHGYSAEFQMKIIYHLFEYQKIKANKISLVDIFIKKIQDLEPDDALAWICATIEDTQNDEQYLIISLIFNNISKLPVIKTDHFYFDVLLRLLSLTKKFKDKYPNRFLIINKAKEIGSKLITKDELEILIESIL